MSSNYRFQVVSGFFPGGLSSSFVDGGSIDLGHRRSDLNGINETPKGLKREKQKKHKKNETFLKLNELKW